MEDLWAPGKQAGPPQGKEGVMFSGEGGRASTEFPQRTFLAATVPQTGQGLMAKRTSPNKNGSLLVAPLLLGGISSLMLREDKEHRPSSSSGCARVPRRVRVGERSFPERARKRLCPETSQAQSWTLSAGAEVRAAELQHQAGLSYLLPLRSPFLEY